MIKKINIKRLSEEEKQSTLKEAKILEILNHPNIIRFKEVYKTKAGQLCIVMDYADDGDLQAKIKGRFKQKDLAGRMNYFTEDELLNNFTQICLAMKHCHDKKILHRDLKSQNIFCTKKGIVKLGDFGIARVLSNTRSKAKTVVGTPYYLSPEIIKSEAYSFKSDIWSLGVLLYEMAALTPPFNAGSLHQLAQKIIQGRYAPLPSHFSPAVSSIVADMLKRDPAARPTIHQILKIPVIERRIQRFLQESVFKDEFSHTLLHNQNVFEEFKKIQTRKKQEEEAKAAEAERQAQAAAERERQLAAGMNNLGIYQPPESYMEKYNDPAFFNHEYQKYVANLAQTPSGEEYSSEPTRARAQTSQEDRAQEDLSVLPSDAASQQPSAAGTISNNEGQYTPVTGSASKDEMINISSCDFPEFKAQMSDKFGGPTFEQGFAIIKQRQQTIFEDNGEETLLALLMPLFPDQDTCRSFINYCTTYLIVQNLNVGV